MHAERRSNPAETWLATKGTTAIELSSNAFVLEARSILESIMPVVFKSRISEGFLK